MHRLAEVWAESPPADVFEAADFAPNHREYAECIEAKYSISSNKNISEWFAENTSILETSSVQRELNGVVAVALLDYFRKDPSLWKECGWLNHWDPGRDETFPDYLDSWSESLRGNGIDSRAPDMVKDILYHCSEKSGAK